MAMTELAERRKRLLFRAWRRGFKEADLIMGAFAEAEAQGWDAAEIAAFEALLDAPDHDVFAWLNGHLAVPAEHDTALFARLKLFCMREDQKWTA